MNFSLFLYTVFTALAMAADDTIRTRFVRGDDGKQETFFLGVAIVVFLNPR